jgi:hypothetical protein
MNINKLGKRPIEGFPDYAVDLTGVWSYKSNRYLKPSKCKDGYLVVVIYNKDGRKTKRLHRLIAQAFIPNPLNLPEVDHINHKRDDYRFENLRWVTKVENRANMSKEDKEGFIRRFKNQSPEWRENNKKAVQEVLSKIVKWYHEEYGSYKLSATNLQKKFPELKLDSGCLSRVSKGKRKSHKNWRLI